MMTPQRFPYIAQPSRTAIIFGIPFIIAAVALPLPSDFSFLRPLIGAIGGGAWLWALFQALRQRRAVTVQPEMLIVQNWLTGRRRGILLSGLRGVHFDDLARPPRLLIAYERQPVATNAHPPQTQPRALTEVRPSVEARPQRRLLILRSVHDLEGLAAVLHANSPTASFPPDFLEQWANNIRLRVVLLSVLCLLATPCYMIALIQISASVFSLRIGR